MNRISKIAILVFCLAFTMALFSCSNGSDSGSSTLPETPSGTNTTPTPTATPTPSSTITYTVTFNANDGSENPATATQTFTAGVPQALKTISELGFYKDGFNFAGWGTSASATESVYADGAEHTADADITFYALWSAVPVYSVNIINSPNSSCGSAIATPATGIAGTEIALSNTPNFGYRFVSYIVTDADGAIVTVTDGKFTMPAKNVTVTAVFTAMTYTISFNANDGSQSPATATQTFTSGIPQALKTITELGFSKGGFNFAGWGTSASATESVCADGAEYIASADIILYAIWSAVPVYSVNIINSPNSNCGAATATPATGIAGTEIALSNTPAAGYQFASYTVTDADGAVLTVTDGKFSMPEKNVTVTAAFSAISYNVNVGTFANGSVTASAATATVGNRVTLTATPASGYILATLAVTDSDGISVAVNGTGNSQTFAMPAKHVTVTATFRAIKYNINIGTIANGSVTANPSTATIGTEVTLSNTPNEGYQFDSYTVTCSGGDAVSVTDGKFIMPAKPVSVTATFSVISYKINVGTTANGNVVVSNVNATIGTSVTLTARPEADCRLVTLTVIDSDGTSVAVSGSGNSRTFNMPAKNVTVTALFALDIYMTLGSWPQTIASYMVDIDESVKKTVGDFTCCKGSDGEWYVEIEENGYRYQNDTYSDGTSVEKRSANCSSYKWFKMEPIKWRVLTKNYNGTGKKLLLAENILISKCYDATSSINYQNSEIRKWLNSNANSADVSDHSDSGGFLNTAFTASELATIADTSVDNSERTTFPDEYDSRISTDYQYWNNGSNQCASDTPTIDKIFLLSAQEVTKSEYGFCVYSAYGKGNARIRQASDYAKASGLSHGWWLRSPCGNGGTIQKARCVIGNGNSACVENDLCSSKGVVPALCVE